MMNKMLTLRIQTIHSLKKSNLVNDDDDDDDDDVFQKTRRGRQAGSWRNTVLRKELNVFF